MSEAQIDANHERAIVMDGPNLFADLGRPDADDLLIRSQLMQRIRAVIEAGGLTRAAAAKLAGLPAPEMTHLLNGRISRFSIERLVKVLNALDPETRVEISFSTPEPVAEEVPATKPSPRRQQKRA